MHFEVFKHTYFFLSLLRSNWRKPVFEGGPAFPWPRPQISLQKHPFLLALRRWGRFVPIVFWYMTGETAEAMVEKVYLDVTAPRHLPHTPKTDKRRRCILDARNRALLVIIWLRQYLKLHVLAHMCQISKSTVAEEIIYHIVPVLILNFRHYMYHMT